MEHQAPRSSWQCKSAPISSASCLESSTWGIASTLGDHSSENAYSIGRTNPESQYSPSVTAQRSSHSHSLNGDRKFSGLISMYPATVSPSGPINYMARPMPHTPSQSAEFSLWDDSLVDLVVDCQTDLLNLPAPYAQRPGGNILYRASARKSCAHYHVTSTPLWRRNPATQETLCNACGLYLQQRHRPRPRALIDADIAEDELFRIPDSEYTGRTCNHCLTRQTSVWRRSKAGAPLCNACGVYLRLHGKSRPLSLKRNKIKPRITRA
ncbi:hypothetical protein C8R45DRAFT_1023371 [Mycena sanguinolenta]|nr:hypothetical protein C8R45DRAFT_1023371 [Mycena sanguinolenta]